MHLDTILLDDQWNSEILDLEIFVRPQSYLGTFGSFYNNKID